MLSNASKYRLGLSARLTAWFGLLLIAAVFWTGREIPGFGYALLMDDDTNIIFNPHIGELDVARLRWMFTDIDYVARYLPLGWLSFGSLSAWSDLSPFGCHLASVSFHALNAVMVFLCLQRLARRFAEGNSDVERTIVAGMGALLWALHPLRVEPVAWCSGLLYVQGSFFALVAIYARMLEHEARRTGTSRGGKWFWLSAGAFLVSLLTYPVALFFPVLIILLDFAWLRHATPAPAPGVRRTLGREAVFLGLLSGLALAVTLVAREVHILHGVPPPTLTEFGLGARAFQAAYVWASYIWRTLWPIGLTPVMEALFEIRLGDVRIWAAGPTLLAISALAWRWRKTAPFFGACWAAYLIWMVPVLGLREHPHTAGDRYSYLISALISVVVTLGVLRLRTRRYRHGVIAAGFIGVILCAGLSVRQARIWRDPLGMHQYVLTHLKDVDLRNIALIRIAKLQFLAGDVRGGRAAARKVYDQAPQIAGVVHSWRELAPPHALTPEEEMRPLQEWAASPIALLHDSVAREQLAGGHARAALAHLNLAVAYSPESAQIRFRRMLVLTMLGQGRAALHDWLVLETRDGPRVMGEGGMRFAANQVASALRAAGDERLALALQRRAAAAQEFTGVQSPRAE